MNIPIVRHPEKINKPATPLKKNQRGLDQKFLIVKFFYQPKLL